MNFKTTLVSKELRYSLGVEKDSGVHFAEVPAGMARRGLDPRVEKVLISDRKARYQLKEDSSVYFVMYSPGIKPKNHLLPLSYDELDAALTDGLRLAR